MTNVLDRPAASEVQELVDGLDQALDGLAQTDTWTLSSAELVRVTGEMQRLQRRMQSVGVRLVREVDVRGAAIDQGATSTAAWLRWAHRFHPATAKRIVDTARALFDDTSAPLVPLVDESIERPYEQLREAFAAGELSDEHVQVVTQTLDVLPDGVDAPTRAEAEELLVEQGRQHDPKVLAQIGKHLRHVLDREAGDTLADEEQREFAKRSFLVRQRRDGSSDLAGHLDPELTALLMSQLMPLAAPRAAADGTHDMRTTGQRNADALADLLRITAGSEGVPSRHGSRPTVAVHMSLDTLQRKIGASAATLDASGPLSAEAARRLACDAKIIPVVLGAKGEPLDVGRASYPATQSIWRALVARDGGCSFAGCDRPPEWTEAHHIVHWEDFGVTAVENMCLLCDYHHRVVHHHGWEVAIIDGAVHVIPPAWVDPSPVPRRNTQRAELAALVTVTLPPDDTADVVD